MLSIILVIALSYLVGSIPTSIITGKILKGIDIRQHGSGNAGATNVFRVLGWKPGVFVMLFDIFKGFAATWWIARIAVGPVPVNTGIMMLIAGCAAIFGHIWTVFAGFKGGKGVGTAAGMIIALYPLTLLIYLGVFIIVFLATRIVSLSSITAAISLPIVLTIFRYVVKIPVSLPVYIFGFFASALIIYTHRSNIKRLINGTENRFGKKKTA
ncbi:MAG TPA: glycerol-3-phosphate 1-O-acyltransferase PlsY [bacterium]|nr:glycerol-3-phosphate 1-O-acyltransferase PlsY [bacterium]HPN44229.1 glycerol-3-phosphate 1-O-acyltransferase PlsY [bacterium]